VEYARREEHQLMMMKLKESGSFLQKRTKKLLEILCCAGLTSLATIHYSAAKQEFSYEPAVVQLSGIVVTQEFYGPPNYGENPAIDSKERALILNLDAPINVISVLRTGPDQDSYYNERHVQLVDLTNLPLKDFIGQHVSLCGTLFEKENGNHHTDVLMDVQNIVRPTGTNL
jgi:hypothetical protein